MHTALNKVIIQLWSKSNCLLAFISKFTIMQYFRGKLHTWVLNGIFTFSLYMAFLNQLLFVLNPSVPDNSPFIPLNPTIFYIILICSLLYFYRTVDKFRVFGLFEFFSLHFIGSNRRPAGKLIKQMLFHRRGLSMCMYCCCWE